MDLFLIWWKPEAQHLAWSPRAVRLQPRGLTLRMEAWPFIVPHGLLPSGFLPCQRSGFNRRKCAVFSHETLCDLNVFWGVGAPRGWREPAKSLLQRTTQAAKCQQASKYLKGSVALCHYTKSDTALLSNHPILLTAQQKPSSADTSSTSWEKQIMQTGSPMPFCNYQQRLVSVTAYWKHSIATEISEHLRETQTFYICHLFPDYLPGGQALHFDT